MKIENFYKTTTKKEMYQMITELAEIASINGDPDTMILSTKKLIQGKIDSEQWEEEVNKGI
jgi:hypothetical protein